MQLSYVLFQVEISTKSFPTSFTGEGLLVVVRVHVESKVVDLVEGLIANGALERFLSAVGEFVIFVISLLVKAFPTVLTDKGFVPIVDPDMSVQSGAPIKRFSTGLTLVRFLGGVDDFMATEGGGLSKPFAANFANEGPCSGVNGHVSGQVVMSIEHFPTFQAGEGLVPLGGGEGRVGARFLRTLVT